MNIQRILPLAAVVLLGGCAVGYTYRSDAGSGDYYYGDPHVEYRYHGAYGAYGGYGPYGAGFGPYGYYGGYYGAWGPYGYSRYHGPYIYGSYGYGGYGHGGYGYGGGYGGGYVYRRGYSHDHQGPRNRQPDASPTTGFPRSGMPPPSPPPQSAPTPRSQGNAGEGRHERAKIKTEGREE